MGEFGGGGTGFSPGSRCESFGPLSAQLASIRDPEQREDLDLVVAIAEGSRREGGSALVVGGYTRDLALRRLGQEVIPKDLDVEIYGLDLEQIMRLLERIRPGASDVVGMAFGVIKFGRLDVSLPRRDSKTGPGHKGFDIVGDPSMSVADASRRRDFTINAIALDPLTGEVIDEHGGLDDLRRSVLRATDPQFFGDDPLRVLRAMQFAARFGFTIHPETVALCLRLDLSELPRERIGEEWLKLLRKAQRPSIGLDAARDLGVITQLHPELGALIDVPQEADWHPEGDVWSHTKMVVDAAAAIVRREGLVGDQSQVIMLGALCHDLGKPATTVFDRAKGRITSYGHEVAGVGPTETFLHAINVPHDIVRRVIPLVRSHLYPAMNREPSPTSLRRLATRLYPATIRELVWVSEADQRGRAALWGGFPEGESLLRRAAELAVIDAPAQPVVMGRHLIAWGLEPGPQFGLILRRLYEAQQDGLISSADEGRAYFLQHITHPSAPPTQRVEDPC